MKTGSAAARRTPLRPAVIWFTGLSGSGKSTIAERLVKRLRVRDMAVEHLDGDDVRRVFPDTGFSREAREAHLLRVGYMAGILEKHGVTVVATFVSPYRAARRSVRALCGNFVEVHVATPLDVCEQRDVKGLYARARRGEIEHFTGISDPYEEPEHPEVRIDAGRVSVDAACDAVMACLHARTGARRTDHAEGEGV